MPLIRFILPLFVFIGSSTAQTTVGLTQHNSGTLDDGYVLFAPIGSTKTYLIDKCGKQMHSWTSSYKPGQSCYILDDGTLLRAGNANNTTFNAGGKGGIIEKFDWAGNLIWNYTVSSTTECQHHDVKALPNGNVLAIVWESKTNTQAIAEGRDPSLTTTTVWSEKIIEIQPVGATGGNIVWEWHIWDHLIQDFDNTKPNYGTIASNPQLININYSASANTTIGQDWIHLNSIDYNEATDQILLSSHSFDEVWIIDHSTTTSEAAGHTGGNSNFGGDILYRWGNPQAYDNGNVSDQKLFGQHNANWIDSGLPYQNQIMIFNNGNGRTGGNYSTVEIINPPSNGYVFSSSLPYLPSSASWIYNANNSNNFYAQNISGAQQLSNGNVIVCDGPAGTFKEVDSTGNLVWEYINPVNTSGIISQGTGPAANLVFRCGFYPSNYSGIASQSISTGSTIESSNANSASCSLALNIDQDLKNKNAIRLYPNPANQFISISVDVAENYEIELLNELGEVVYKNNIVSLSDPLTINTSQFPQGMYFIILKSHSQSFSQKLIIEK